MDGCPVWHTPVIFVLVRWGLGAEDKPHLLLLCVVTAAVTLGLSAITYRFVERPALARKRAWTRTTAPSMPRPVVRAAAAATANL